MRGLAAGEKGFEKLSKTLKDNFVFLNVYCTSVAAEHDPRGPDGPYQFKDRSVPVLVFKKWNGETLKQQLGFYSDPRVGRDTLVSMVEQALKKHRDAPRVPEE